MSVLLALAAALAYGISDFIGGLASRRTSAWPVALLATFGGLIGAVGLAALWPGTPTRADLWWGVLAGVGSGMGGGFLYRGLAAGRMGVVAPVSAVGAALIPVAAGLAGGERLSLTVWLGVLVALPGIWLVSREPADDTGAAGSGTAAGIVDGLLAGTGFGVLFAALGQVPEGHGFWPLAINQALGCLVVLLIALALREPWVPRHRSDLAGLVGGLLASAAMVAFVLATQQGLLVIASVLTSFYPAVTVLLAALLLREPIHRGQAVGLALCALTVGLVAAG